MLYSSGYKELLIQAPGLTSLQRGKGEEDIGVKLTMPSDSVSKPAYIIYMPSVVIII